MMSRFRKLVAMAITPFVWGFRVTPFSTEKLVARCPIQLSSESYLPFQECWDAGTTNINPLNDTRVDTMLQRLCSPAPQSYFIVERFLHNRQNGNRLKCDFSEIQYLSKPGYQWKLNNDDGYAEIIPCDKNHPQTGPVSSSVMKKQSTLELAHEALNIASKISPVEDKIQRRKKIQKLVNQAKERLQITLGTDIRGRASADAAFSFALAGVDDKELYQILSIVAWKELERAEKRLSFQSKTILQMVERLAAAGLRDDDARNIHRVAANYLEQKGEHLDLVEILRRENNDFDLFSSRPLLWLWRFSSRQTKVKEIVTENMLKSSPLSRLEALHDLKRPLVVDVGCGMGVSILGLATTALLAKDSDEDMTEGFNSFLASEEGLLMDYTALMQANFVGCDLSELKTGYAQGIVNRWNLGSRVQFVCQSAQDFLEEIEANYPGEVPLVLVQFPSPFKFRGKADDVGNSQLPLSSEDGFLACKKLLHTIASVLRPSRGYLLLQSNVEDVAVVIRNTALTMGFESVPLPNYQTASSLDKVKRLPQRTVDWMQSGGERAVGDKWSAVPLLPRRGATETEISYEFLGTNVHRCLLQVSSSDE